ncbi:MAG: hypothetical protein UE699_04750 [Bacilli bacterium]|nr:hypothetical protein [Bacilli bacterium]
MKKRYIVILIIIAVYFTVFFLLYGRDEMKNSKLKTTLIIGDNTIWQLDEKKWYNIANAKEKEELNWKEFTVFVDNEKLGKYNLVFDNKWYLFDNKRKPVSYSGSLIAYSANYEMKIKNFNQEKISDYTKVNKVLSENNISTGQELTSNTQISVDIDNDGVDEKIYVVGNVFPRETDPDYIFSVVFMEKNDIIYPIYKSVDKNRSFNGCKPYINSIIDVNDDNKYEIVLSCSKYSTEGTIDMLYKFNNDKFSIIVSNQ